MSDFEMALRLAKKHIRENRDSRGMGLLLLEQAVDGMAAAHAKVVAERDRLIEQRDKDRARMWEHIGASVSGDDLLVLQRSEAERDRLQQHTEESQAELAKHKQVARLLADQITYESKPCPDCNPDHIISPDPNCPRCGGKGYVRHSNDEFVAWAAKQVENQVAPEK